MATVERGRVARKQILRQARQQAHGATSESVFVVVGDGDTERRTPVSKMNARVLELLAQNLRLSDFLSGGFEPQDIVDRMLSAIPKQELSEWDDLLGPFYTTAALNKWRDVSRQRHHALKNKNRLLLVHGADGQALYPSFQFSDAGELLPGLPEVLEALEGADFDEWMTALWFNSALETHGGRTAADLMRAGDLKTVLQLARADTAMRAQR